MKRSNFTPVALLFLTLLLIDVKSIAAQTIAKQIPCLPRPVLVSSDLLYHAIVPHFLTTHRCSGGVLDPNAFQCQATHQVNVAYNVLHTGTATQRTLNIVNHTECQETCVCQVCVSSNETPKSAICPEGQKWNPSKCRCDYNCLPNVGERTKTKDGAVSVGALIGIMFIELIVICIVAFFVFDLNRCRKKRRGFLHQASVYVKSSSGENMTPFCPDEDRRSSKLELASTDDLVFEPQESIVQPTEK